MSDKEQDKPQNTSEEPETESSASAKDDSTRETKGNASIQLTNPLLQNVLEGLLKAIAPKLESLSQPKPPQTDTEEGGEESQPHGEPVVETATAEQPETGEPTLESSKGSTQPVLGVEAGVTPETLDETNKSPKDQTRVFSIESSDQADKTDNTASEPAAAPAIDDPEVLQLLDGEFAQLEREIARIHSLPAEESKQKITQLEMLKAEWYKKAEESTDKPEWQRRLDLSLAQAFDKVVLSTAKPGPDGTMSFSFDTEALKEQAQPLFSALIEALVHKLTAPTEKPQKDSRDKKRGRHGQRKHMRSQPKKTRTETAHPSGNSLEDAEEVERIELPGASANVQMPLKVNLDIPSLLRTLLAPKQPADTSAPAEEPQPEQSDVPTEPSEPDSQ